MPETDFYNFFLAWRDLIFGPVIAREFGLKIISLVLSPLLLGLVIYLLYDAQLWQYLLWRIKDFFRGPKFPERVIKIWHRIEKKLKIGGARNFREAVLDADRVLRHLLVISGYQGKTVEELLANVTPAQLSNAENLKKAHKVRDRLVRDSQFSLTPDQTSTVIGIYRSAFEEWGLLD